jgi:hypothetical protein
MRNKIFAMFLLVYIFVRAYNYFVGFLHNGFYAWLPPKPPPSGTCSACACERHEAALNTRNTHETTPTIERTECRV